MSETRVLGAGARKIGGGGGARNTAPTPPPAAAPEKPKKRRGRVVLLVVVLLAVLLGGAAGVVLGTGMLEGRDGAVAAEPEPEPGLVVTVEPRNINLADNRYLRMGFAVQLVEGAEEITTAQATDAAIALFSGREVAEVNDAQVRLELQDELKARLVEIYGEEVLAVYYTEFVTQ